MKVEIKNEYADKTAISFSFICLVHCLLAPSFLVLISSYITLSYDNELVHYILLFLAIPVSVYALFTGARNHLRYSYFALGLVGISSLIFAVTIGVVFWGEFGEKFFTTIGALVVAFSHYKNFKLCREVDCDSCH